MKKLYILTSIYSTVNYSFEIDSIISDSKTNDVTVLMCDGCVGDCHANTLGLSLLCHECKKRTAKILERIPNITVLKMKDYYDKSIVHDKYSYSSLKELNKIMYRGFEIGYGVSSYYISLTRNLTPQIDNRLKRLLDSWLDSSMSYADVADKVITNDFDLVYVVNGRYFDTKPFQEDAISKGIHLVLGESAVTIQGKHIRMNFDNIRVHSLSGNTNNILNFWDNSIVPLEERRRIASSFYEKKIKAIRTNDKVYTQNQKMGLLPDDWDSSKTNIVIFNSSEDEFAAIGGEWEKDNLFESQIAGIKYMLENTKDRSIHFYLRVHPNLKTIKYKYHTDLYKFASEYNNITVIPGNSPISSYALMGECDKVITFGSTMGVEAAYAGKPSMVLLPCLHYFLNINYVPKTKQDVIDFIEGRVSFTPDHENTLKFSYYYYNDERKSVDNPECEIRNYPISFFGKQINTYGMNYYCSTFMMKYYSLLNILGVFASRCFISKREQ